MKCSNCGAEMPNDAIFCVSCGSRAEKSPTETCKKCQMPLNPGAQFCNGCGEPVNHVTPAAGPACPQCAAPVAPDTVFCPNCGAKQQKAGQAFAPPPMPAQPYPQQPYAAPVQPMATPVAPPPYYANPYNPYTQPVPPAKPKARKKGLFVALAIILVVLLAFGGVYALFGRDIKRLVLGPKATYLSIEGKTMKQSAADLVADLAKYGNETDRPEKGGQVLDINVDLNEATLGIDPAMAAALENITIQNKLMYDNSEAKPRYFNQLGLLASDEPLLTMEAFYDTEQVVIGFPEILDQCLVATSDDLTNYLGLSGMDAATTGSAVSIFKSMLSLDLGIDEAKMKDSLNDVIDIMLDNIDEAEYKANQTLEAGDVSAKYDLYTVTVQEEGAKQMFLDIFKLIRDDEQFYNLASQMAVYGSMSTGFAEGAALTKEAYQTGLDDMISQLEAEDTSDNEFTMVMKVYVGKDDQVYGRDLTIESADGANQLRFQFAHPVDGSQEAFTVSLEADQQVYAYTSSFTVEDEKSTGKATITANGAEVAAISFKDLVSKTVGSTERLLGSMDITLENLGASADASMPVPTGFTFSGSEDGDKYLIGFGIPDWFSITVGQAEIAAGDVTLPTYEPDNLVSITDQAALSGLMTPDVQQKFMEIVQQLGLMQVG